MEEKKNMNKDINNVFLLKKRLKTVSRDLKYYIDVGQQNKNES